MSKFYRINQQIQAPNLRVIDPEGNQLGILSKQEALEKAQKLELDLIEIAHQADPPVARILDFQKFRYQESKKEQAAKKGASEGGIKEIWLSPRIAEHDLMVRLKRVGEFIEDGFKVKLTVKFKGREMAHPENGHKVINRALVHLGEGVGVEREPKFEGRRLSFIIGKSKGGQHAQDENKQDNS